MVLNNHEPEIDRQAKVRTAFEYFKDGDFGQGARPKKLFMSSLMMEVENQNQVHRAIVVTTRRGS